MLAYHRRQRAKVSEKWEFATQQKGGGWQQ